MSHSVGVNSAVAARLGKLGYVVIDSVAELTEINTALTAIFALPGVSKDLVTRDQINEIVKGLFGYEATDNADSPEGTPQGGHNRRGIETLPGI